MSFDDVKIPCEFCGRPIPFEKVMKHSQEECEHRFGPPDENIDFNQLDYEIDFVAAAQAAGVPNFENIGVAQNEGGQGGPGETLCNICQRYFKTANQKEHEIKCQFILEQISAYEALKKGNIQDPVDEVRYSPPPEIFINCEFCNIEFPSNEVEQHRKNCGFRKEYCNFCRNNYEIRNRESHSQCQQNATRKSEEIVKNGTDPPKPQMVEKEHLQKAAEPPKEQQSKKEEQSKQREAFKEELKKESCKIPYNPLLDCIDQTENENQSDLSDDDGPTEYLEEFWNRAQSVLQKQKKMSNF